MNQKKEAAEKRAEPKQRVALSIYRRGASRGQTAPKRRDPKHSYLAVLLQELKPDVTFTYEMCKDSMLKFSFSSGHVLQKNSGLDQ
jgi:hypothetical protein